MNFVFLRYWKLKNIFLACEPVTGKRIVSECIYEGFMYAHDMSDCLSVCFFVCLSFFRELSILLSFTTGLQDTHFLKWR